MLRERRVEFAELALSGIGRLVGDPSKREWLKASLVFYLRRDAEKDARPCPAFPDLELYIFPYWECRILFEIEDDCVVIWSVLPAIAED